MNKISPVTLDQYAAMDMAEKRQVWLEISDISEGQFEAHMTTQKAREADVLRVGAPAPDFIADSLGPNRQRTGGRISLSSLRGKPVGLVFGSYT